ncbi:MAG TPA: hypothetical protein VIS96_05845 [Terrimicrobiaceae bacterium]
MDAVNAQTEWDEAMARVLAFFSTLRIGGVEHRVRIALRIVEEARRRHEKDRSLAPVEAAMDVAAESLDHWFAKSLGGSPDRRVAAGLVALEITDAGARFPNALLSGDPPEELKAMLSGVSVHTGPDLAISSMTPREMDYGAMEVIAQETWHRFDWTPLLRAAAVWTAIFFFALYTYDRFFPQ